MKIFRKIPYLVNIEQKFRALYTNTSMLSCCWQQYRIFRNSTTEQGKEPILSSPWQVSWFCIVEIYM